MVTYAERPWAQHYDPGVPKTLHPYPDKALHDFLRETAQKHPLNTAIYSSAVVPVFGRRVRKISYRELDSLSDALATGLVQMGLKKGDRVAIVLPNVPAYAISYYAVLKAGGVVAATNPTYPADKMAFQINDCDAAIIITMSLFYPLIKQIQPKTKAQHVIVTNVKEYLPTVAATLFGLAKEKKEGHRIEQLQPGDHWLPAVLKQHAGQKPNVTVKGDDLALFQYTGGTTGVSKGAMSKHKGLVANILQMQSWLQVDDPRFKDPDYGKETTLGAIPMFHVYGMVAVLGLAIATGVGIALVIDARNIDDVVDQIHTFKPKYFAGVPALFNAINNHSRVKSGEVSLASIQVSNSGSAPLPPVTKREFEKFSGGQLRDGFGMSEAPTATHTNPVLGENRAGSIGLPLPDMDMRIVDLDDGETDVPVGEVGELLMAGPNVMVGYHGMPTETANVLREKDGKVWLYTGDIARMDEQGYFYIVDRKKDMALIGGFNVYPANIEKAIKEHPAVLEVGVAAVPHPEREGQEALKAWIVLKPQMQVTEKEVIELCSKSLAPYEVPRRIAFVAELPKSAVGKTLRRELIQMELEEREKELLPKPDGSA